MATFAFSFLDEAQGLKAEKSFVVTDEEAKRICECFCRAYACKPEDAFAAMVEKHMLKAVIDHVCAWEQAQAATPIVPKPE